MADDCVDEVKVFRKVEVDDDDGIAADGSSQQLQDDKQEVAYEAEVEIGGGSAFHAPQAATPSLLNTPLANVQSIFSSPSPYLSPLYPFAALTLSPHYLALQAGFMAAAAQRNAFAVQNPVRPDAMPQGHHQHHQPPGGSAASTPTYKTRPSSPASSTGGPLKSRSKENSTPTRPHIKKPLNAYMMFMKETRAKLLEDEANSTKQSSDLNAEMGKMWNTMSDEQKQPFFEKARLAKEEHSRMYPDWSARDNYAIHKKKKTKRIERLTDNNESKKCRARFGIDNTDQWCRHCKRKKKCLLISSEDSRESSTERPSPSTPSSLELPDCKPSFPQYPQASAGTLGQNAMSAAVQQMAAAAAMPFPMSPYGGFSFPGGFGFSPFGFGYNPAASTAPPKVTSPTPPS